MRLKAILVTALLTSSACVSNQLKSFVGEPIEEAYFAYGDPEKIMELGHGHKAYLFRFGANAVSEGCRMTLITEEVEGTEIVNDYRVPKGLVC
ncbi:MAG: hypothetical protein RH945_06745 [Hyphomonas sp.]